MALTKDEPVDFATGAILCVGCGAESLDSPDGYYCRDCRNGVCDACGDEGLELDRDHICEVCARELADEAAVDRAIDLSRDDDFDRCGE